MTDPAALPDVDEAATVDIAEGRRLLAEAALPTYVRAPIITWMLNNGPALLDAAAANEGLRAERQRLTDAINRSLDRAGMRGALPMNDRIDMLAADRDAARAEVEGLRAELAIAKSACETANRLTAGQKKLTDKAEREVEGLRGEVERLRADRSAAIQASTRAADVADKANEVARAAEAELAAVREANQRVRELCEQVPRWRSMDSRDAGEVFNADRVREFAEEIIDAAAAVGSDTGTGEPE